MASLRTADGQWECPVIGADRAPAVPKIATEPDASRQLQDKVGGAAPAGRFS